MDDPDLAKALRDGKPRPLPSTRRWPFVLLGILAALVFVAGVLTGAFAFLFVGGVAMTAIVYAYRRQVRRAPRVRASRRRIRPER
jgi:anti-sigma factor RsiW